MSNPFITEVKIKDNKPKNNEYNEQFERVRAEHTKLMAAVMKYNEKVGYRTNFCNVMRVLSCLSLLRSLYFKTNKGKNTL